MRLFETTKQLITSNTKDMKNKPYYTNEVLVQLFNECDKIKRDQIAPLVEDIFKCENYHQISDLVNKFCEELWPEPKYSIYDNSLWKEWTNYMYGYYDHDKKQYIKPLMDWVEQCEVEYIWRNGKKHTYEEACEIAAKKWCELIFGWHLNDNGALNEQHPGGFPACAFSSVLKNDISSKIPQEQQEKAYEEIKKFYKNDCWFEYYNDKGEYEDTWQTDLSVDYGPNRPLHEILKKASIEERHIDVICPWKTTIRIDEKDNSVIWHKYGNKEIL